MDFRWGLCYVSVKDWAELRQYFVPVKNTFVFLPIWLNFLYFGRITPVCSLFSCFSCHVLVACQRKKWSQIFKWQEALWNYCVWRPNVASLPVSSSLYWGLGGEDNGFNFYLPLSWYMHHVCTMHTSHAPWLFWKVK